MEVLVTTPGQASFRRTLVGLKPDSSHGRGTVPDVSDGPSWG